MNTCDRCGREARATIMSRFNTQILCMDCERKERAHPDYQRAKQAEVDAVRGGNRNFQGIGLPEDLR